MYGHIRCICTVLANPILCAKRLDAGRCPIIVEKAGSQWFRRCRLSNSCSRRSVAPAASEVAPAASEVAPVASEVAPVASEVAPASLVAPAASVVARPAPTKP